MQPTYDPEFTPPETEIVIEMLSSFSLPDNTVIKLYIEKIVNWEVEAGCLSFSRDDQPSRLTGQGYSVRIFREILKRVKDYANECNLQYVFFVGPLEENREPLYHKLMQKALKGTKMRYVDDPWDDFYRVRADMLDYLDMVEGSGHKVFVVQRLWC